MTTASEHHQLSGLHLPWTMHYGTASTQDARQAGALGHEGCYSTALQVPNSPSTVRMYSSNSSFAAGCVMPLLICTARRGSGTQQTMRAGCTPLCGRPSLARSCANQCQPATSLAQVTHSQPHTSTAGRRLPATTGNNTAQMATRTGLHPRPQM